MTTAAERAAEIDGILKSLTETQREAFLETLKPLVAEDVYLVVQTRVAFMGLFENPEKYVALRESFKGSLAPEIWREAHHEKR